MKDDHIIFYCINKKLITVTTLTLSFRRFFPLLDFDFLCDLSYCTPVDVLVIFFYFLQRNREFIS